MKQKILELIKEAIEKHREEAQEIREEMGINNIAYSCELGAIDALEDLKEEIEEL